MCFWGNGIVATAAPGMATRYPFSSHPSALPGSVHLDGLYRIDRASGGITTGRRKKRRDAVLVNTDNDQKNPGKKAVDQTEHRLIRKGFCKIIRKQTGSSCKGCSGYRSIWLNWQSNPNNCFPCYNLSDGMLTLRSCRSVFCTFVGTAFSLLPVS